jgi:cobalt-zinc-cadmium efflux system membrane fusion protein
MLSQIRAALGVVATQIPTMLVLGVLVAVGVWGYHNDWKLPESLRPKAAEEEEAEKKDDHDEGQSPGPVVLASDDAASLAGIDVGQTSPREVAREVEAVGVLAFDQTRYAQLAPRSSGTVWRILKAPGDEVRRGEVLALLSSPEAGKARSGFFTAYVQHEIRLSTMKRVNAAARSLPDRQVREARLAYREARGKLLTEQLNLGNLGLAIRLEELEGLSDDQVAERVRRLGVPQALAAEPDLPANLLPLVVPFVAGAEKLVVVRRDLVLGEMADPAKTSFVLADVGRLWLKMDVRQEDAPRLEQPRGRYSNGQSVSDPLGQKVAFRARATGQEASGTLRWLSPEVDPKTRTVRARADVYNPTGQLRPGTFGRATITLQRYIAPTVPTAALQWDGKCYRVFVRRDKKTFEPVLVLPGAVKANRTEVLDPRPIQFAGLPGWLATSTGPWQALAGWQGGSAILTPLEPGATVATSGSHVIKAEMQKNRIGGED